MNTRVESLPRSLAGDLRSLWQNARVRALLQVLFLLGMGALATYAKSLSLPLGIPGHSAVLWLGVMVAGRTLVNKNGAGTLMGVSVPFWAVAMSGMHMPEGLALNGFGFNLGIYGISGLALDLFAKLPRVNIRHWFGAMTCGILAMVCKIGFQLITTFFSSTTRNFILFGVLKSVGLHIVFGAMAGLLGWGAYRVYELKQRSNRPGMQSV
jgi:hypothetical protein